MTTIIHREIVEPVEKCSHNTAERNLNGMESTDSEESSVVLDNPKGVFIFRYQRFNNLTEEEINALAKRACCLIIYNPFSTPSLVFTHF